MDEDLVTCVPQEPADEVKCKKIDSRSLRHLPVMEGVGTDESG